MYFSIEKHNIIFPKNLLKYTLASSKDIYDNSNLKSKIWAKKINNKSKKLLMDNFFKTSN